MPFFPKLKPNPLSLLPSTSLSTPLSFSSTTTRSSSPNPAQIAHLILTQKTPTQALETFNHYTTHTPLTKSSLLSSLTSPTSLSPPLPLLNSLLNLLVHHDIDLARKFFRTHISSRADPISHSILMKGLCRTNRIADAFKLLKLTNQTSNPIMYNTLIHALCRLNKTGRARSLLGLMPHPTDVTFNIMISAYCNENNLVQALVMLEKSFALGFVPDKVAVTKLVALLCDEGRAMEAVEVLERVEERGGVVDVVGYNTLIKGFCGVGKVEVGRAVLKKMERKGCLANVKTFNVLMEGFCGSGKVGAAMDLYREMETDGIKPGFETFDVLIRGFCLEGRVEEGLKILNVMEEKRDDRKMRVTISPYNSILYGFYKGGRLEEGYEFLKRMQSSFPRAVEKSLRILEFCKEGEVEEAKLVYDQMVKEGSAPSVFVYVNLIEKLCEEVNNVREAFQLMNEMVERGFFPLVSIFNCLICGFCRLGQMSSAFKLLEEMVRRGCSPNPASYNPLISAFCAHGDLAKASGLLVQMVERGIVPDHSTWNHLLMTETFFSLGIDNINYIDDIICKCYR